MTSTSPRRIPELEPVDPRPALELLAAVTDADVHEELDTEYRRREDRATLRAVRRVAGPPRHCGGCQWIHRKPSCPRCGFTEGYGYPR